MNHCYKIDVYVLFSVDLFIFSVTEALPGTVTPTETAAPQMPLLMQLYTSPDYRFPLASNTKVQCDKRIYAEVSNPSPS